MKQWYAVYCKVQQDARAEENLKIQGFDVFRPLVRVRKKMKARFREVVESMFPRYLFIYLDNVTDNWAPIRSTRGVADLVRWSSCVPAVPNAVIDLIRQRLDSDQCVDLRHVKKFQLHDRIRIINGPFAGYEGLFEKQNGAERVVVLLKLMRQELKVELPETVLAHA